MIKEILKTITTPILFTIVLYGINKVILYYLLNNNQNNFIYSIEMVYGIFATLAILILLILIKVRKKNLDIVGNTFLLLTIIKMVICYLIAVPFLKQSNNQVYLEKWNFFAVCLLFLFLETMVTIKLLNKKD